MDVQEHKPLNLQRHSEKAGRDRTTEYTLPDEILENLENSSSKKLRSNIQKHTKDVIKYDGDYWTKAGTVNKVLVPELKNSKLDVYQTVHHKFKDAEKLRFAARGATETLEEFKFVIERGRAEDDGGTP